MEAIRWREAASTAGVQAVTVARQAGTDTAVRAAGVLRSGGALADEAGSAVKGAVSDAAG